jgi:hypothetical protein
MVTFVVLKVLATLTHSRNFNYLPTIIVTKPQVFTVRRKLFWNPGNLQRGAFSQGALSIESHGSLLQTQSYKVQLCRAAVPGWHYAGGPTGRFGRTILAVKASLAIRRFATLRARLQSKGRCLTLKAAG